MSTSGESHREESHRRAKARAKAARMLGVIREVMGSVSEEQWRAMAKGVLRKIVRGEGDVSEETRQFAAEQLRVMEEEDSRES